MKKNESERAGKAEACKHTQKMPANWEGWGEQEGGEGHFQGLFVCGYCCGHLAIYTWQWVCVCLCVCLVLLLSSHLDWNSWAAVGQEWEHHVWGLHTHTDPHAHTFANAAQLQLSSLSRCPDTRLEYLQLHPLCIQLLPPPPSRSLDSSCCTTHTDFQFPYKMLHVCSWLQLAWLQVPFEILLAISVANFQQCKTKCDCCCNSNNNNNCSNKHNNNNASWQTDNETNEWIGDFIMPTTATATLHTHTQTETGDKSVSNKDALLSWVIDKQFH